MRRTALLLALLALLPLPAAAQDIAFRGWGLRAGIADDPDQVVLGAQFNFGEFIPRLRFQPNVEVGFGDDANILSLALPVHYRYAASRSLTLYGGGGLALGLVDVDDDRSGDDDGSEFDISPMLAGGLEWPMGRNRLSLELNVAGGDFPAAKLVVGWMF
ncbi:MAG TPA: hypothetical protein VIW92_17055 [Thermoanaerobaculia bacterium]